MFVYSFVVVVRLILLVLCCGSYDKQALLYSTAETDPCNKDVYRILPRAAYRGGACLYDPDKQTCDAALITSWYRAVVNGKDLRMQEEEAYLFECGTKWPFWMNGIILLFLNNHDVFK